jgi:hypothetical protein
MSDVDTGPAAHVVAADGHGDAHGHDAGHGSGHGHDDPEEPLGPLDLAAWAYAIAGGLLGLVTAMGFYMAAH